MRLFAISDLHREFFSPENKPVDVLSYSSLSSAADVIILAGDIDRGTAGVTWAGQEAERLDRPVLYVPGNHEFYGYDHDALRGALRAEAARWPGLYLLDNDAAIIQGVRFLGTTLWTDYRAWRQDVWLNQEVARQGLSDHRLIARGHRLFSPHDALALHETARRFLETELARPVAAPQQLSFRVHKPQAAPEACEARKFGAPRENRFTGPTVVITHHGPSLLCRHPLYPDGPLSAAFYSDLSGLLLEYAPALWVFGHTHAPLDTRVGATRLYSNPVGYPGETIQDSRIKSEMLTV